MCNKKTWFVLLKSLVLIFGVCQSPAAELLDPTRPLEFRSPTVHDREASIMTTTLVVESILISPRRRIVVINGRTLGEGDFLNGMEITAIDEGGVSMKKDGRDFFLKPASVTTTVKRQS